MKYRNTTWINGTWTVALTGLICMIKMVSLKLLSEICFRSFSSTRYFRASVLGSNTMNEIPVTTRTIGTPWEGVCVRA